MVKCTAYCEMFDKVGNALELCIETRMIAVVSCGAWLDGLVRIAICNGDD